MNNKNQSIYALEINDTKGTGFHARPVAIISRLLTEKYNDKKVTVVKLDKDTDITKEIVLTGKEPEANAKSILNFIALLIKNGDKIAFIIEEPNSEEVFKTIKEILKTEDLIK